MSDYHERSARRLENAQEYRGVIRDEARFIKQFIAHFREIGMEKAYIDLKDAADNIMHAEKKLSDIEGEEISEHAEYVSEQTSNLISSIMNEV